MSTAVREHARLLLQRELERRRTELGAFPDPRRRAVEAAARDAVAAAVTELLGQAAEDARLAAALASIYARDAAGSTVPDAATAG